MGWRFRKSFKVAPWTRLNISKGGLSWSVGGRNVRLNFSKRGITRSISLPGTGLSHSQQISANRETVEQQPELIGSEQPLAVSNQQRSRRSLAGVRFLRWLARK